MSDKSRKKKIDTSKYIAHDGGNGWWNSLTNLGDGKNHITFGRRDDLTPVNVDEDKQFLLDWYNDPATIERVVSLMGDIPESLNRGEFVNKNSRTYVQEEPDSLLENMGGAYFQEGNKFFRDKNYTVFSPEALDMDEIKIHELNHAYGDFHNDMFLRLPDKSYGPKSYKVINVEAVRDSDIQPDINYLQSPTEIHSRLMEIRHYLNKRKSNPRKPADKITKEDLDEALEKLDGDTYDRQIGFYDKDALLYWLNTVADNNTSKPKVNMAAEGGDLDNMGIQDPAEIGTGGLRGLQGISNGRQVYDDLVNEGYGRAAEVLSGGYRRRKFDTYMNEPIDESIGFAGVGDSRYDKEIENIEQLQDLNNTRGELQSGLVQIGSGLAKAGVLAGTTFLDGIIGTVVGIGTAAAEGRWSGLWDNAFSNVMNEINEWSETALPNYYTNKELEAPWYENIFTANFIGDKVIKNLGFAVGAAYSGKIGAGAISRIAGLNKARNAFKGAVNAAGQEFKNLSQAVGTVLKGEDVFMDGVRITEALTKNAKTLRNADPILKITGAFSGALGEARLEAIQNSKDWADTQKNNLDQAFNKVKQEEAQKLMAEFPQAMTYQRDETGALVPVLSPEYEQILEQRAKSRFDYDGGLAKIQEDRLKMGNTDFLFNLPLLTVSDLWQFGRFYAGGYKTARKTANVIKNAAGEYIGKKAGIVEGVGRVLQKGIAEGPFEEMGQSAIAKGAGYQYASELNSFYGAKIDPDAEEETIGFMKSMANAIADTYGDINNYEEGFIGGLTGMLGIPSITRTEKGGIRPALEGGALEDIRTIQAENKRNDEVASALNNFMKTGRTNLYYQAAVRHNKFQRDMDRAVEDGDEFSFKNAEHSQLINSVMMFEEAGRIQDLYDILDEAGNVRDEDIETIRSLTTDNNTGKSAFQDMTDVEVREAVQKQVEDSRSKIETYRKISSNLMSKAGAQFSTDALSELTWMLTQVDDWEGRFNSLHSSVKDRLQQYASLHDQEFNIPVDEEGRTMKIKLSDMVNLPSLQLMAALQGADSVSPIIGEIYKSKDIPDAEGLVRDIKDLSRISGARRDFILKYNEYMRNREGLETKIAEESKKVVEEKEEKEIKEAKEAAEQAQTPSEMDEVLFSINPQTREKTEERLREEGNPVITERDKRNSYVSDVHSLIDSMAKDEKEAESAHRIFDRVVQTDMPFEETANPDNALYAVKEGFENETEFQEALYTVQEAIKKANSSDKFRDSLRDFSETVSTPVEKAQDKTEITEESEVPDILEPPVGITTPEEMKKENSSSSSNTMPGNGYYAPSMSEFSIAGQRLGDFTPFGDTTEGKKYKPLYDFLVENGAFSAVNRGEVKVGDRIHFLISQKFQEKVAENPDFSDTTIFMVKLNEDGSYQIVGTLPSRASAGRFQGLSELEDKLIAEYNKGKGDYISAESVAVSKVMVGRVPMDNNEKQLRNIPGVGTNPVLGVVRNGALITPNRHDIPLAPFNTAGKNNNVYILIPDGSGKYRPVNIRTQYLDQYDLGDVTNQSTSIYKDLMKGVMALANATTNDQVFAAKASLEDTLYLGNIFMAMDMVGVNEVLTIRKYKFNPDGTPVMKQGKEGAVRDSEEVKIVVRKAPVLMTLGSSPAEVADRTPEEVANDIIKAMRQLQIPFQLNFNWLNTSGYNERLVSGGILTSNMKEARYRGTWFTTDIYSPDSRNKESLDTRPEVSGETPVLGTEVKYKKTDTTYYVNGNTITDSNGVPVKLHYRRAEEVLALAWAAKNAIEGVNTSEGVTLLPNGDIIGTLSQKLMKRGMKGYDEAIEDMNNRLGHKPVETDTKETKEEVKTSQTPQDVAIAKIAENQTKIDRANSSEDTMILEDDGQYHPYTDVLAQDEAHPVKSKMFYWKKNLLSALFEKTGNVENYNKYLDYLEGRYNIDLSAYKGKTDAVSRDSIVDIVLNKSTDKINRLMEPLPQAKIRMVKDVNNSGTGAKAISDVTVYYNYPEAGRKSGDIDMVTLKDGKATLYMFVPNIGTLSDVDTFIYSRKLSQLKELFESQYGIKADIMLGQVSMKDSEVVITDVPVKYVPVTGAIMTIKPKMSATEINSKLAPKIPNKRRRPLTRLVTGQKTKADIRKEMKWIKRVLPQLADNERTQIVDDLIHVAGMGAEAWGTYQDGIITLSNMAAEGTLYHEAFHAVMDLLLTEQQKAGLLKEAREKWGNLSSRELEENLAEEFREYTMGMKKSLGYRIMDFFRRLFSITKSNSDIRPYAHSLYNAINEGKFADKAVAPLRSTTDNSFSSLNRQVRGMLERKGYTHEKWNSLSEREKEHALKCASI